MIGPRVGVGGQILSSPDKVGVNAAKQAREFLSPEVGKRLVQGGVESANKLERSRLTIFDESVK
jgi:hypothetical protein